MLTLDTGSHPRLKLVAQKGRPLGGVYGLGRIVQIDAHRAAVVANVRVVEAQATDFEDGSDVILFDDVSDISAKSATTLSANEPLANSQTDHPVTLIKYPSNMAFMPADANCAGARTGFALACVIGCDTTNNRISTKIHHGIEVQQLSLRDGVIHVDHSEVLACDALMDGWRVVNVGLGGPVRDGESLWISVVAERAEQVRECVLMEWRFDGKRWRVESFVPFTDGESWYEPSVTRDESGRWIACARGIGKAGGYQDAPGVVNPHSQDIVLWSAPGPRGPWARVVSHGPVRSHTPVTVATVPGGVVVLGSPLRKPKTFADGIVEPSIWMRHQLVAWKIEPEQSWRVNSPVVLFDCDKAMGPNPGRWDWRADHPIVTTVTLADGKPHTLMAWRTCDCEEVDGNLGPTEFSGLWVGELTDSI